MLRIRNKEPPIKTTLSVSIHKMKEERSNFHIDTLMKYDLLYWSRPTKVITSSMEYDVWMSLCGRYQIARIGESSPEPRFNTLFLKSSGWDFMHYAKNKCGRPVDFRSLQEAMAAVKKFHKDVMDVSERITTNENIVLYIALETGIHNLPNVALTTPSESVQSTGPKRSKVRTLLKGRIKIRTVLKRNKFKLKKKEIQ